MHELENKDNTDSGIFEEKLTDPKKGLIQFIFDLIKSPFKSGQKIGDLNGKWAVVFKLMLILFFVVIPTFFTWATWVTSSVYQNNGEIIYIGKKLDDLPPKEGCTPTIEWQRRIELLEGNIEKASTERQSISKNNDEDHKKIEILLEHIKTKVDIISKDEN